MKLEVNYLACCGIKELFKFPDDPEEADKALQSRYEDLTHAGLVLVTLNHKQRSELEPIVKKNGFEEVSTFYNPNSRNEVTLYCLKINQERNKGLCTYSSISDRPHSQDTLRSLNRKTRSQFPELKEADDKHEEEYRKSLGS